MGIKGNQDRAKTLYILYVILLLSITAFLSVNIASNNIKLQGFTDPMDPNSGSEIQFGPTLNTSYTNQSDECEPCSEIGKGKPNCGDFSIINSDIDTRGIIRPNTTFIMDGSVICMRPVKIRINKHGFRGEDWDKEKNDGVKRVLFLGDSMFIGQNIPFNKTISEILERKLNSRTDGRYQSLNLAVPGYNLREKVEILETEGLEFEPDIVVLQYADDVRSYKRMKEIMEEIRERQPNISYDKLSKKAVKIQRNTLENMSFEEKWGILEEQLKRMNKIKTEEGFDIVLFVFRDEYFEKFKELSQKHNWKLVQNTVTNLNLDKSDLILHEKDHHPSVTANKIYAEKIFKKIA